jgi:hypothetical protein
MKAKSMFSRTVHAFNYELHDSKPLKEFKSTSWQRLRRPVSSHRSPGRRIASADPRTLGPFRRILQGLMRSLSMSFPCAMSRLLGVFDAIRSDLRFFPEKFFSLTPPPHTKKNETKTRLSKRTSLTTCAMDCFVYDEAG